MVSLVSYLSELEYVQQQSAAVNGRLRFTVRMSGGRSVPPCLKQHQLVYAAVDGLHRVDLQERETLSELGRAIWRSQPEKVCLCT